MTAYQNDFFGNTHRADPLFLIFMEKLQRYCPMPPLPITDIYKIMSAEFFANSPQMVKAVRAIIQSGDEGMGLKIVEAAFRHRDMPAPDSVPRAMRSAKKKLIENGELKLPKEEAVSGLPDFDTLLVDIESGQSNIDSGLEARFHIRLLERFSESDVNWVRPGYVGKWSVDFLSLKGGVAVELDSWEFHCDQVAFTKDRRKSRMIQRGGYTYFQYSGSELTVKGGIDRALDEIENALQWRLKHPLPDHQD